MQGPTTFKPASSPVGMSLPITQTASAFPTETSCRRTAMVRLRKDYAFSRRTWLGESAVAMRVTDLLQEAMQPRRQKVGRTRSQILCRPVQCLPCVKPRQEDHQTHFGIR